MRYSDKQNKENIPRNNGKKSLMSTSILPISSLKVPLLCGDDTYQSISTTVPVYINFNQNLEIQKISLFFPPSYFWAVYVEHPWCSYLGLKISEQRSVRSLIFLCLIFTNLNNCFEWISFHFLNTLLDVVYTYLTVSGGEGFKKNMVVEKTRPLHACAPKTVEVDRRPFCGSDICETRSRRDKIQIQCGDKSHPIPSQSKLATWWVFSE